MSSHDNAQDPNLSDDRPDIAAHVPAGARRILDVGCKEGGLGRALKARGPVEVIGIELEAQSAEIARDRLDSVLVGNIETMELPFEAGSFDVLLFADVLEHLIDPRATLARLKPYLSPHGVIITSIPNVRYFGLIHHLVEGNWTYADSGILDRTHLRFFTIKEMVNLMQAGGFRLTDVFENLNSKLEAHQPQSYPADFAYERFVLRNLNEFEYHDLFVFQYILVCVPA